MVTFEDIKQGKQIGKGMYGTIYLGIDKQKNKYAIKIEQIFKKDAKKSLKSYTWRETEFAQTMNKLYPNVFMTLYDYKIDESCKHKQNFEGFDFKMKDLPIPQQNFYKKLWKSEYCSVKLWSYVDTTLHDVLNSWKEFKPDVFYDLFIQLMYIIYLMNKHGYLHRDLHTKNVGVIYTTKKYITILGHKIPTHGMIVQLLDYDLVLHKKYELNKNEKMELANNSDLFPQLNMIINFETFVNAYKTQKIDLYEENNKLKMSKDDINLLKCHIQHLKLSKNNESFLLLSLYKILCYEKYERQIVGNKFKKVYPPLLMMPLHVILFIISNIYDVEKILKYVMANRM